MKLTSVAILMLLGLSACNSSSTSNDASIAPPIESINTAPVISLTESLIVDSGAQVNITATIEDDDEVTVSWTQIIENNITELDFQFTTNTLSFIAPIVAEQTVFHFILTVSDGVNDDVTSNVEVVVNVSTTNELSNWIINNERVSTYITETNSVVLEDVQSAEIVTVKDKNQDTEFIYVEASGIPKYDVIVTQELVDDLNQRPRAKSDFLGGVTSIEAGQEVSFGQNIGFNSSTENCQDTGGDGYWPPGPGCPTSQNKQVYLPNEPIEDQDEDGCDTGLGTIGLMVNGTSIFNWGDGQSYGDQLWYNLAPIAEQYDVDICEGHAAQGEYHHHFYTSCLANLLDDHGGEHSPIYGFAADGYPLYGPYESKDSLAISGWKVRSYGATELEGGCNTPTERSCVLIDEYDVSKGVEQVSPGPNVGEIVSTLSGNQLEAFEGYYYEDYYYAQALVTGRQLDEHNGHDTGDGKGYHYHITLTQSDDGKLIPAFPFMIGPKFKGELADNSIATCGGSLPPGGMPPPGG